MTVIHWGSGIGHSVYPGVTMIWLPINIFAKIRWIKLEEWVGSDCVYLNNENI